MILRLFELALAALILAAAFLIAEHAAVLLPPTLARMLP